MTISADTRASKEANGHTQAQAAQPCCKTMEKHTLTICFSTCLPQIPRHDPPKTLKEREEHAPWINSYGTFCTPPNNMLPRCGDTLLCSPFSGAPIAWIESQGHLTELCPHKRWNRKCTYSKDRHACARVVSLICPCIAAMHWHSRHIQ